MIHDTLSGKGHPAITSDRWHVVHARWIGRGEPEAFERTIVSEHESHADALAAARLLARSLSSQMGDRAPAARDQLLVRRPAYKTLKSAERLKKGPR